MHSTCQKCTCQTIVTMGGDDVTRENYETRLFWNYAHYLCTQFLSHFIFAPSYPEKILCGIGRVIKLRKIIYLKSRSRWPHGLSDRSWVLGYWDRGF
jgi:hypothetical protein